MTDRPIPGAERPRSEPEIIPPGDPRLRWEGAFQGTQRVYVARLGPFGFALMAFLVACLAVVILLLLLGAFLISLPLAALIVAIAVIASMLRGSRRRR